MALQVKTRKKAQEAKLNSMFQMIDFGGFEIFDSGIFLGRKMWQVFFFGGLI